MSCNIIFTGSNVSSTNHRYLRHHTQGAFLLRDSYAKRGICRRRVTVCLSHSGNVSKRLKVG